LPCSLEKETNVEESRKAGLSWAAAPLGELLRLSWPITVSTISYSVMTLVDTLLVGHLGAAQLAGVGLGGTVAFALLCFAIGLLRGSKTLVSQAMGAGKPEEAGAYLGAALAFAGAIGLLTVGAGELVARLLPLISATSEAGAVARTYLSIRTLGAPMALAYVALREVRYGVGDARLPMVATVIANLVNIALACAFVYGLHWGAAGAAWATVIAHSVEAGVLALRQRRHGWHLARTQLHHLRSLWRVGLPTAIQFTLEVGSFAMLAAMVAAMSEVDMAAHQIALQVVHFSFLPAFAVAEAASVLAGQAVGADRDALVLTVARQAMAIVAVYTGVCTLALALGAPLIVSGFTASPALAFAAVRLLHVAAVFNMFDGANIVARAALRGTGDVRFPAVIGVVTSWALTPPLTWWLGYRLNLRAFGGWLGLCCEIIAGALILWWRLERRSWLTAARASRAQLQASPPVAA
jgi:MATE family, multidrug efflux pump